MNSEVHNKISLLLLAKARFVLMASIWFCTACATPNERRLANAAISMMAQPQNTGPCITSLLGQPTKNCLQWQPNVDAAPYFDSARRLIFVGAGDDYLHVLDGDGGQKIAQIKTAGRAITKPILGDDKSVMYFGTDKAVVYAIDAFSYAQLFSFTADSKINNDLVVVKNALVFTSAIGTVYSIDSKTGELNWKLFQPLAHERLRLSSNSNILVHTEKIKDQEAILIIVPHADGYISLIDASSGVVRKQISLGSARPNSFPDIVAPMVMLGNQLWVASYDLGVFTIDTASWQIRDQRPISKILQMAATEDTLFLASADWLNAISNRGRLLWKTSLKSVQAKLLPLGYPFGSNVQGFQRLFFGVPSRLLLRKDLAELFMGTSQGSFGVFDLYSGRLLKILGNSVGFGPKIDWAETNSIMAVSRRGLLTIIQVGLPGQKKNDTFGPSKPAGKW